MYLSRYFESGVGVIVRNMRFLVTVLMLVSLVYVPTLTNPVRQSGSAHEVQWAICKVIHYKCK